MHQEDLEWRIRHLRRTLGRATWWLRHGSKRRPAEYVDRKVRNLLAQVEGESTDLRRAAAGEED